MQQQQSKTLKLWGFHCFARLGEAECDPVITCQRATLNAQGTRHGARPGPSVRLVYTLLPCVLRNREREEIPTATKEIDAHVQKKMHLVYMHLFAYNSSLRLSSHFQPH